MLVSLLLKWRYTFLEQNRQVPLSDVVAIFVGRLVDLASSFTVAARNNVLERTETLSYLTSICISRWICIKTGPECIWEAR